MICRINCLVFVVVIWALLPLIAGGEDAITLPPSAATDLQAEGQGVQDQNLVHVYFADRFGNYLQAEKRNLASAANGVEKGRLILKALIKGPRTNLARTIPTETRINAFFLGPGGRAYVDLSEDVMNKSPGGCKTEMLTVYSIVNSLVLNMPEVTSVKILINGQETPTIAGHIDNRYPYTADMLLIR
jgi:spore germination protein GerM